MTAMTTTNDMKKDAKRNYQKATMRVVEMSSEAHLLSSSGSTASGPSVLNGALGAWKEIW